MTPATTHVGNTPLITYTFLDENGAIVDLTSWTTRELVLTAPDGTVAAVTLTVAAPTSGVGTYQCLTTTFTQAGDWILQGELLKAGGRLDADVETLKVLPNLR